MISFTMNTGDLTLIGHSLTVSLSLSILSEILCSVVKNKRNCGTVHNKITQPRVISYVRPLPLDDVDGPDHLLSELHAASGVVLPGHWEAGHAVVAVAQQLDAEAVAFL